MPQPLPTPGDDAPSSTSEAVEALARALESMSGEWDEPEWRGGSLGDLGAGQALHGDWDAAEAEDEGNGNVATGPAWLPSSLGNAQGLNFTALLTGLDDDPLAALTAAVEEDRPRCTSLVLCLLQPACAYCEAVLARAVSPRRAMADLVRVPFRPWESTVTGQGAVNPLRLPSSPCPQPADPSRLFPPGPRFAPSAEWQAAMGASQADEDAGELVTTDAASGGPPSPRGGAASLRAGAGDEVAASPASSNRAGASSGQGATAASEDSEDTSIPCAGEALG